MSRRTVVALLAGSALVFGTWAWAQQGGPGQWPMGPMGPGGMGAGRMGGPGGWGMMGGPGYVPLNRRFTSNGERIYYTGISARTRPIPTEGGPMWMAHGGGRAASPAMGFTGVGASRS